MGEFKYPCVVARQGKDTNDLIMFSAPSEEIRTWVGIPQRLSLSGDETAGFQRTISKRREESLRQFFKDHRNVIQNPLLCAIRNAPGTNVTFVPGELGQNIGHVRIVTQELGDVQLAQLLGLVRLYLEARIPELARRQLPRDLIVKLEKRLGLSSPAGQPDPEDDDDINDAGQDEIDTEEAAEEALFDESQITEFWDHVRAREHIAGKLRHHTEILGFSREILASYLQPVILVDGQHRLHGALLAGEDELESNAEAKRLITEEGKSAEDVRRQVMPSISRSLPVSMLMDESPAEHVFQYVLVNQKATPVPRALLGTIISTSLAAGELEDIADRLEKANIPLEGSKVISSLTRNGPFAGLIGKGLEGDGTDKLPWTVIGSVADIFRRLEGARFYHDSGMDHAVIWRRHELDGSGIVADWRLRGFEDPLDFWQEANGPWWEVFNAFWTRTRDTLAVPDDPDAPNTPNAWGRARRSNIFNKPSLHILATDFFAFLKERRIGIASAEHVSTLVDDWLEYVSPKYFARDWKLEGVKKDSVGTKRQWSKLWSFHRQTGGDPPAPSEYSKISKR